MKKLSLGLSAALLYSTASFAWTIEQAGQAPIFYLLEPSKGSQYFVGTYFVPAEKKTDSNGKVSFEDHITTQLFNSKTGEAFVPKGIAKSCSMYGWTASNDLVYGCKNKDGDNVLRSKNLKTGETQELLTISPDTSVFDGYVSKSGLRAFDRPHVKSHEVAPILTNQRDMGFVSGLTYLEKKKDGSIEKTEIKGFEAAIYNVGWSEDESTFFVQTVRREFVDGQIRSLSDLYLFDPHTKVMKKLPYEFNQQNFSQATISQKGDHVAVIADQGKHRELIVVDRRGNVKATYMNPYHSSWVTNTHVLVTVPDRMHFKAVLIDVESGTGKELPKEFSSQRVLATEPGQLRVIEEDYNKSSVVRVFSYQNVDDLLKGKGVWKAINTASLDTADTEFRVEEVNWKSFDGLSVEGALVYPENYDPGQTYPMVVLLPDQLKLGLHKEFVGRFSPRTERSPALYASEGYFVLLPNVRGTPGYGKDFIDALGEGLGVDDGKDILSGIDSLAEKGLIDRSRVSLIGKGYGGTLAYMTALQDPSIRSVTAVTSITNWPQYVSRASTDSFPRAWYGNLGDNLDLWMKRSPVYNAQNFKTKTPVLLQHAERDNFIYPAQTEQLAYVLERMDFPVEASLFNGYVFDMKGEDRVKTLIEDMEFIKTYNPPNKKSAEKTNKSGWKATLSSAAHAFKEIIWG